MIRKITNEDLDIINSFSDYSVTLNTNPFNRCFCIIEDNKIIGYIEYACIYDKGELNYIFIDPKYRSKGYGIKLLNCNTNKNSVIVTWPYFDLELNHQWITNDIIVKYKTFLKQTYNMELEFPYNKFWWIMFGCKWETFCDICQFIFGFLDYLFPNESWKNINNLIDFRDNQYELSKTDNTINKDHPDMRFYKDKRFFAFLFEQLLPVYVSNKFNIIVSNNYNIKIKYCYEQNMNMNNLMIT